MPRDTPTPSFRTSARRNDYHLSTPPPLRTGAPLVVVARGRRFRIQLTGSQSAEAHSPTLTEPASSPINPANAGRALRRARRIVEPAELDLESHAATVSGGESGTIPTVPGLDQQVHDVTPTSSPTTAASQHGHDDLFSTHGKSYTCSKNLTITYHGTIRWIRGDANYRSSSWYGGVSSS